MYDSKSKLLNTVIDNFVSNSSDSRLYESEEKLEKRFIEWLVKNGYEYCQNIKDFSSLEKNLRLQIENLNNLKFSDDEWHRFSDQYLTGSKLSQTDKNINIQDEMNLCFKNDNNEPKNIKIIDKIDLSKNHLQVINQFENKDGIYNNRYDVTLLINGLPLVHIELKKRGVSLNEAFNQIARYKRESFSAGNGLFEFIQIFIISNGTETKYFSNSTLEISSENLSSNSTTRYTYSTQSSYKFAIFWTDQKNREIKDLYDFTNSFLLKENLLNILTKYCVLSNVKKNDARARLLKVMRPYQIAATEAIINKTYTSTINNQLSDIKNACGYIWHATGSGKTLTSFKTAVLLTKIIPNLKKVFFVVDRKDLDVQTAEEFNKFQKGSVLRIASTNELAKNIESDNKIIVTTIQKLHRFIKDRPKSKIFDEHVVFVFDECHRSQFGDMHKMIISSFKKYNLFGFTGTPIFSDNANSQTVNISDNDKVFELEDPNLQRYNKNIFKLTTQDIFGPCLHTYTIFNAIKDESVLRFKIDYKDTITAKDIDNISDQQISGIDKEAIFLEDQRIYNIAKEILILFPEKTKRIFESKNQISDHGVKKGFNSILAVASIDAAKKYYLAFKELQKDLPDENKLKIATIFTFKPNELTEAEKNNGLLDDDYELELNDKWASKSDREFLDQAIEDYNNLNFDGKKTSFSTRNGGFEKYFEDISKRTKNRSIDILIVVDMFLTGFDAPGLNTLWVDKNLKYQGLIQAFSRTNRILDENKPCGNIVCYRNLKKATDDALRLFGTDENAINIYDVIIRPFNDYYHGYINDENKQINGYVYKLEKLKETFPVRDITSLTNGLEEKKAKFVQIFSNFLKSFNFLRSFDEFNKEKRIISQRDFQDYLSVYNDLYTEYLKKEKSKLVNVNDEFDFSVIDIIKGLDINADYILNLIKDEIKQKHAISSTFLETTTRLINSSLSLQSKKELIIAFLASLSDYKDQLTIDDANKKFANFINEQNESDLEMITKKYNLKYDLTKEKIKQCFEHDSFEITESQIKDLTMTSIFGDIILSNNKNKESRKEKDFQSILSALQDYYDKYHGMFDRNLKPIMFICE